MPVGWKITLEVNCKILKQKMTGKHLVDIVDTRIVLSDLSPDNSAVHQTSYVIKLGVSEQSTHLDSS